MNVIDKHNAGRPQRLRIVFALLMASSLMIGALQSSGVSVSFVQTLLFILIPISIFKNLVSFGFKTKIQEEFRRLEQEALEHKELSALDQKTIKRITLEREELRANLSKLRASPVVRSQPDWVASLGLHSAPVIKSAFKIAVAKAHPDAGGSDAAMRKLINARDKALREVKS